MRVRPALALAAASVAVAVVTVLAVSDSEPAAPARPPAQGPLLAILDARRGPDRVVWLDPRTLVPRSRPLRLGGEVSVAVPAPGGGLLALGMRAANRVELIDLQRWRRAGRIELPGPRRPGFAHVGALAWPHAQRLLTLTGDVGWRTQLTLADPIARRPVRAGLWHGAAAHVVTTAAGMVLLTMPRHSSGVRPASVVSADAGGRVRRMPLGGVRAGVEFRGSLVRFALPALAADPAGRRAYVIPSSTRAVEVDLRDGEVRHHRLDERRSLPARLRDVVEPPAHAGGGYADGVYRDARMLADGRLAVSGYAETPPRDRATIPVPRPLGLTLIDPDGWRFTTAAPTSSYVQAAGLLALAGSTRTRTGSAELRLEAIDSAGRRRFATQSSAGALVLATRGWHAYVRSNFGRALRLVDLQDGRTLRLRRHARVRLLVPLGPRAGPARQTCSYGRWTEILCLP